VAQRDVMPAPSRRLGRPPRGTEGDVLLRVLDAARVVFLTEGFEAASIDAIAGSAGLSKKTIYARFASKVDLFEAVCVRFIEENVPSIEKVAAEAGSVEERLHRIALAILETVVTPDCIAFRRVMVAEAGRFPEFARALHDFGLARVVPLVERCLEDGVRSGAIAVDDVRHAADAFLGLTIRGFVDRTELGLERPGMTHVKRATLKRSLDFFLRACRP